MITHVLEIIGGLMLIFGVPFTFLKLMHTYQERKNYHRDYDKRYAIYMKSKYGKG